MVKVSLILPAAGKSSRFGANKLLCETGGMASHGQTGNPVIFHRRYRKELMALEGDRDGKTVLKRNKEDTFYYEAEDAAGLKDIDRMEEAGERI